MSDPKTVRVFDRIWHLHQAYLREFAYRIGLNLRQLECLLYCDSCNRYSDTPLALAEYLGVTKGTISQTILSLEGKKLLRKVSDPNDGRVVHLQLTRRASKLLEQCRQSDPLRNALEHSEKLTPDLSDTLTHVLRTMQQDNAFKTFGVCHSCAHFRRFALGNSHQCGLTQEPLSDIESLKICREHEAQ